MAARLIRLGYRASSISLSVPVASFLFLAGVGAAAILSAGPAKADTVVLGSDYLSTTAGSFINLDGLIVDFMGNPNYTAYPISGTPTNLGGTDTILQRTSDITIGVANTSENLLVKALSLESTTAVPVTGIGDIPIFASLDPNNLANDTGTLSIFGTVAGGTFASDFTAYLDLCTGPGVNGVGCGSGNLITTTSITLGSPALAGDLLRQARFTLQGQSATSLRISTQV